MGQCQARDHGAQEGRFPAPGRPEHNCMPVGEIDAQGPLAGLIRIVHHPDQGAHSILTPLNPWPFKPIIPESGGFIV